MSVPPMNRCTAKQGEHRCSRLSCHTGAHDFRDVVDELAELQSEMAVAFRKTHGDAIGALALMVGRIESLIAERNEWKRRAEQAADCGQQCVCAKPPGCARHWEERNRELVREAETLRAERDKWRAAAEARTIEVVPAPGDRCGNTSTLEDGSACPGCRACS